MESCLFLNVGVHDSLAIKFCRHHIVMLVMKPPCILFKFMLIYIIFKLMSHLLYSLLSRISLKIFFQVVIVLLHNFSRFVVIVARLNTFLELVAGMSMYDGAA